MIGNLVKMPKGYNFTFASIFSGLTPNHMTLDDNPIDAIINQDGPYGVAGKFVKIPPGDSVRLTVEYDGQFDLSKGYQVTVRVPPLATTIPVTVTVDDKKVATYDVPGTHTVTIPPNV